MPQSIALALAPLCGAPAGSSAETGYDLWLRYSRIQDAAQRTVYRRLVTHLVVPLQSPTGQAIAAELERGVSGLFGEAIAVKPGIRADWRARRGHALDDPGD